MRPAGRPVFLKMVYHGPRAVEEFVRFDPHLVVGILGGSAGTTRDAFQLLHDAQKAGAKVALYGRKINHAENQLAFVQFLRLIVDGVIGPVEAVKAYHAVLAKLGIRPHRALDDDLKLESNPMSYAGTGTSVTVPATPKPMQQAAAAPCACQGRAVASTVVSNGPDCGCHGKSVRKDTAVKTQADAAPYQVNGRPDFARMDVAQRLAYHRERLGLGK